MATILATIVFMLLVVTAMSVGVIFGRKPIAGSCGGVGAALADPEYICDLCGNDPNKCREESEKVAADTDGAQFYDASRD